jgi:type III secretory pathway component EscV
VRVADLGDHEFRVRVNGLVRCSGELTPGRYGQPGGAPGADVWVGPLSRVTHARLPDGVSGGFDAVDRLMRHIRAAVREAAAEFADADWAKAFLDRLGHTYGVTVPAVRTAAGDDLLAVVLRELVGQGVEVADPRLMELVRELVRSPQLASECAALAITPPAALGRTARAMAEWLRQRLAHSGHDSGVPAVELGPRIEAAVRRAVASADGRVPVYSLACAGAVLRCLEEARIELGAAELAIVTTAPLRPHVIRLIAAQFPTAEVILREELDPELLPTVVDLPPAATSPAAPESRDVAAP